MSPQESLGSSHHLFKVFLYHSGCGQWLPTGSDMVEIEVNGSQVLVSIGLGMLMSPTTPPGSSWGGWHRHSGGLMAGQVLFPVRQSFHCASPYSQGRGCKKL